MTTVTAAPTFDPTHFERLFAVEDRHAWFRARGELLGRLVADLTRDLPHGYRVLEVGCGTGAMLQVLERVCARGEVIGMDLFAEGLSFARQRTACQLVVGDANDPPFGAEFSLVCLFDVLEHLPEDLHVLRQMHGLLLPGGALMLTVPADPTLWSYFDESACHVRRYEIHDLKRKLDAAGFEVAYITHFMRALAPIMRAYRRLAPLLGGRQGTERDFTVIPIANEVLYRILRRESSAIEERRQLTTGTSILAIARRPMA